MHQMGNNSTQTSDTPNYKLKPSVDAFFVELKNRVQPNPISLKKHLKNFVFETFVSEDQKQISQMLLILKTCYLSDLIYTNLQQKEIQFYEKVPMLSARVFQKLKQFFQNAVLRKKIQHLDFEDVQKFGDFIREHELTLSYNRYGFQKKIVKFRSSYASYQASSVEQQSYDYYKRIKEWAEKQNIQFITRLLSFLTTIGLLVDNQSPNTKNIFLLQLERIKKQEQRQLFLHDICNPSFQEIQFKQINQQQAMKRYPNYAFYKNQKKVRHGNMDLEQMHNKIYDYNFLEGIHDYIQWMFPNHYGSAFNSSSVPLSYTESYLFQKQLSIGIAFLRSIYIFFDFMGIRINLQTLELSICSERRLKDVILKNFHNHLRIMRILACLSVTGFRKIAINLIDFLDKNTSKGGIIHRQRGQFERSWEIYGEKHLQQAKRMCFLETQNFPQDHKILETSVTIYINHVIQSEQKDEKVQPKATFLQDLNDFNKEGNKQAVQNAHQIIKQLKPVVLQNQDIKFTVNNGNQLVQAQTIIITKAEENGNQLVLAQQAIIVAKSEENSNQLVKAQQNIIIDKPEDNIKNEENKVEATEQKTDILKQYPLPHTYQKGEMLPYKQKQVQQTTQNNQITATVEQTISQINDSCC